MIVYGHLESRNHCLFITNINAELLLVYKDFSDYQRDSERMAQHFYDDIKKTVNNRPLQHFEVIINKLILLNPAIAAIRSIRESKRVNCVKHFF